MTENENLQRKRLASLKFWVPDLKDLTILAFSLGLFLLQIYRIQKNKIWQVSILYEDGMNEIYSAFRWKKTLENPNIILPDINYLPVYPYLLNILIIKCKITLRYALYIIEFASIALFNYFFRRFLISFNAVRDPLWSTLIVNVIPISLVIIRVTPNSDILFYALTFANLTFYARKSYMLYAISLVPLMLTRAEGILVAVSGLLMFLIDRKPMFTVITSTLVFFILHRIGVKITYSQYFKEISPSLANDKIFSKYPFQELYDGIQTIGDLRKGHGLIIVFVPIIFGVCYLMIAKLRLSILPLLWTLYLSFLQSNLIIRLAPIAQIFTFIIAFDRMWDTKKSKIFGGIVFLLIIPITLKLSESNVRVHNRGAEGLFNRIFIRRDY